METGWRLRRLQVRPEGFWDGLAKLVGAEDLQLDSFEFNQRFLRLIPEALRVEPGSWPVD